MLAGDILDLVHTCSWVAPWYIMHFVNYNTENIVEKMDNELQSIAETIHENFMDMYHSCIIASEESFPDSEQATLKLMRSLALETSNMQEVFNDILHEYISEIRAETNQGELFDV
jgi:hypothetical protein